MKLCKLTIILLTVLSQVTGRQDDILSTRMVTTAESSTELETINRQQSNATRSNEDMTHNAPAVNTTVNEEQRQTVYPGAVAVAGINASENGTDAFTTTAPASVSSSPLAVEARLVQGNEEDVEELQEELQ